MSKLVHVKDLKDGQEYGLLLCLECGGEYSADARDYWNHPLGHIFKCCDVPNVLVRKRTSYTAVST